MPTARVTDTAAEAAPRALASVSDDAMNAARGSMRKYESPATESKPLVRSGTANAAGVALTRAMSTIEQPTFSTPTPALKQVRWRSADSVLQVHQEKFAEQARDVFELQRRVEGLKLEHASESIDARLLGEQMVTRLAAAQAMQAAAAARRFARVDIPAWLDVPPSPQKPPSSEGEADALAAETAEAHLERMHAEHVRDRGALHSALQREDSSRLAEQKEELDAACRALDEAKSALEAWPSTASAAAAAAVETAVAERVREEDAARKRQVQEALRAAVAVAQAAQAEEKRSFEVKLDRERAAAARQASALRMHIAGGALGSLAIAVCGGNGSSSATGTSSTDPREDAATMVGGDIDAQP